MPSKRILLMYITEISGHHSATLAIEKALKSLDPSVEVLNINAFKYTNPISEKIVNRLYMSVIKATPQLWDYLYDNPSIVKSVENIKKTVHKFNSSKLTRLFEKFKPDAVACTQAFPCGMCADYKKNHDYATPLVAVLTDYIPHSYWIYDTVDYYITPTEDVAMRLVKKGVPPEKIKSFGIPFDLKFNEPADKDKLCKKYKLNAFIPTILIMGGGQGLGPIKTIVKSLDKVKRDIQQIIVCGTNKKLYRSLKRKIKKYKNKILLFGYFHNVNELMAISNMIVTKPGGVTTSELLSKRIAMIIVKPIPGQEANNANYLTAKGAAIRIDEPKKINLLVENLLWDSNRYNSLLENAAKIAKPNAVLDIARLLLELCNKQKA